MTSRGAGVKYFATTVFILSLALRSCFTHTPLARIGGNVQTGYFKQIHGASPREEDLTHEFIPRKSRKHTDKHVVVVLVTPQGGHNASEVAQENGFTYHKPILAEDQGYHLIQRDGSLRNTVHGLDEDERIEWWETQEPKMRVKRGGNGLERHRQDRTGPTRLIFRDPMYNDQWHLNSREARSHTKTAGSPENINTLGAWTLGYTGRGVNIGVVDDGLERVHPDLSGNYRRDLSYDYNDDDGDPTPSRHDSHGTAASGVAAADKDSTCGVGVAFDAGLAGIRLLGDWATDSEEAQALSRYCDCSDGRCIHVFSNSWGPMDDGARLDGPGRVTFAAIERCIQAGRGGLGSIYMWAGGNGRNRLDNSNYDGYANSRYTIAVAATTDYGTFAWYSEPGANIVCTAPSSGDSNRAIVTTDLQGTRGYNTHGDCTFTFGGTSATAPQGAGVSALILQANPWLGWRDVQHIYAVTSRVVDLRGGSWVTNGAGFRHSYSYGFGMIDASAAVRVARGWTPVTPQPSVSTPILPGGNVDFQTAREYHWTPNETEFDRLYNVFDLEHVQVFVDAATPKGHGYMGVQLCSPVGTCSIMAEGRAPGRNSEIKWTYMTVRNWGEKVSYPGNRSPHNRWTLRIGNFFPRRSTPITLNRWQVTFHGSSPHTNNIAGQN